MAPEASPPLPLARAKACACCSKTEGVLTRCSRCKMSYYCSRECQLADWKAHKGACAARAATGAASTPPRKPTPWKAFTPHLKAEEASRQMGTDSIPSAGLANLGNTCFLNCVLQCLVHSPPFWHYFSLPAHSEACTATSCVHCELCDFTKQYAAANNRVLAPRALVTRTSRTNGLQLGEMHDSQEFLLLLLDGLLKSNLHMAPTAGAQPLEVLERLTLQHHIFGGTLRSVIECSGCGHSISRAERLVQVELAVNKPGDEPDQSRGLCSWVRGAASRVGFTTPPKPSVSVEELLQEFVSAETLDDYRCDGCGIKSGEQQAKPGDEIEVKKRLTLSELPMVLVLTLKRYSMGMYGKISRPVTFGEELDLSEYYEVPKGEASKGEARSPGEAEASSDAHDDKRGVWARYRLCGVVVHHDVMNSCFFGHYVAYVRQGEEWLLMDDDDVTRSSWSAVSRQKAYMLFYQKVPEPEGDDSLPTGAAATTREISQLPRKEQASSSAAADGRASDGSAGALYDDLASAEGKCGEEAAAKELAAAHPAAAEGRGVEAHPSAHDSSCEDDSLTSLKEAASAAQTSSPLDEQPGSSSACAAEGPRPSLCPEAVPSTATAAAPVVARPAAAPSADAASASSSSLAIDAVQPVPAEQLVVVEGPRPPSQARGKKKGASKTIVVDATKQLNEMCLSAPTSSRGNTQTQTSKTYPPCYSIVKHTTFYKLTVFIPDCDFVQYPGCGGSVRPDKYVFRAPGKYDELEVAWPTAVIPELAVHTFNKRKRQVFVKVPIAPAAAEM
ncbi:hypothetical protein AB1Y20_001278 [Prymnesium parvum]|uniref:ubiquitinyl hydrolase 1 n=1 Tax=Prymnesium parvum TaxID=97485 RepID=A0AB34K7P4_PRYPA